MGYPFVQAKWYREGGNLPINRLVIHDMEYPERSTAAEDVAKYFQQVDRKASAHYCVDNDSVVQCVHEEDGAYHAPPNIHSLGIELAGYARQSPADWRDAYSTAELKRAAVLSAEICIRHNLPARWLTVADLKVGIRGITSHNNVSKAFGLSTHTDPGPAFPAAWFIDLVREAIGIAPDPGGDDVPLVLVKGRPGFTGHVFIIDGAQLTHLYDPQTAADMGLPVVLDAQGHAVDVKNVRDIGAGGDVWYRLPAVVVEGTGPAAHLVEHPPLTRP